MLVTRIDRLTRSLLDPQNIVHDQTRRRHETTEEPIDTSSAPAARCADRRSPHRA
jgi:hypothetical protein